MIPDLAQHVELGGVHVYKNALDKPAQVTVLGEIRWIIENAPLFRPVTRWGKEMSVEMTSAGSVGWVSDRRGYRYEKCHPTGCAWPDIPQNLALLWKQVCQSERAPDCCLVNYYSQSARMGLHQDRDEADFDWPVLSISLGDDALFRVGGQNRNDKTQSIWLSSGDLVVLSGPSRLAFHGIDRVRSGSSDLLPEGGRFNLTMRVVF